MARTSKGCVANLQPLEKINLCHLKVFFSVSTFIEANLSAQCFRKTENISKNKLGPCNGGVNEPVF